MDIEYRRHTSHSDVWSIIVDGEVWKNVHQSVFGKKPALPSSHLTFDEWQSAWQALEYRLTKQYVLRRLTAQSYHSSQLAKLLKSKLVSSPIGDRLIQECLQQGYLDDANWIEGFMRHHRKRLSLRAILMKLKSKGLSQDELSQLAEQWQDPQEEVSAICHLIQTRYRTKNLQIYADKQKVISALARKGYSFDRIREAIENLE